MNKTNRQSEAIKAFLAKNKPKELEAPMPRTQPLGTIPEQAIEVADGGLDENQISTEDKAINIALMSDQQYEAQFQEAELGG